MKYFFTFIALCATIGFTGCKTPGEEPPVTDPIKLTVDPTQINFDAEDNEDVSISITLENAEGINWSFETKGAWITCTAQENGLLVNVRNNDGNTRTGSIEVTAGDQSETVNITQSGNGGNIAKTFTNAEGKYIGVSECGYTGEFTITLSEGANTLVLTAFDELYPIPGEFAPATGEYTLANTNEFFTFVGGSDEAGTMKGSFYTDGEKTIAINNGSFTLSLSGTTYTLNATVEGVDSADQQQYAMSFEFTGTIGFSSDLVLDYKNFGAEVYAKYYGDYRNDDGIGRFDIRFTGETYQGSLYDGCQIKYWFTELSENPAAASIPEGVYRIRAEKDKFTILPGSLNAETGALGGAYFFTSYGSSSGGLKEAILAEYGTLVVRHTGTSYEIYAHFAGRNLQTKEIDNFAFMQTGDFDIQNMIPSSKIELSAGDIGFTSITSAYYGDYYSTGGSYFSLTISLVKNPNIDMSGYTAALGICSPMAAAYNEIPEGTYTISTGYQEFTCVPGVYDTELNGYRGSQFYEMNAGGGFIRNLLFNEGTVIVSKSGTNYTVDVNIVCQDALTDAMVEVKFTATKKPAFSDKSSK